MFSKILFGKTDFRCPYCLHSCKKNEILNVCLECNDIVASKKRTPVKCKCGSVAKAACPLCSNINEKLFKVIPQAILEYSFYPLSIVGATDSGKDSCITVMLTELNRIKISGLNLELIETEHQKKKREMIYEGGTTPRSIGHRKVPDLLMWHIKKISKKTKKMIKTFIFGVYHIRGEDIFKNIIYSEALIITIDPLTLDKVRSLIKREDLDDTIRDINEGNDNTADEALQNIMNLIKNSMHIRKKKLDIPVAIVFTKFDTIVKNKNFRDVLGEHFIEGDYDITDAKIDIDSMKWASNQIEAFLSKFQENNFVTTVKANFNNYIFFCMSRYDIPPRAKETTLKEEIKQYRVLALILWVFHQKGFLDKK